MKLIKPLVALVFLVVTQIAQAEATWTENYDQALKDAKAGHKKVLLNFTGSDWCVWCKKLDQDVFSKPEFETYAKKNLVLVKLDFPNDKPQTDAIKAQNEKLQAQYKVDGYPTLVLLDPAGKALGQIVGYVQGGPAGFAKALEDTAAGKKVDQ